MLARVTLEQALVIAIMTIVTINSWKKINEIIYRFLGEVASERFRLSESLAMELDKEII